MGNILFYLCFKRIPIVDDDDEVDATTTTPMKNRITINCSCCKSNTAQNDDEAEET